MSERTITKCYLKVVTIKYRNTYANKVTKGKGVFVSEYLNRKFKNSDVLYRGISEKVYCFIHNMNGRPKCKFCGGDINRKRALKGMTEGYQEYCSKSCINKHGDVRQKIGNNIIDKFLYHHEYPKFSTKKEELQFLVDTFPRHYQEILKIDRYHELMDYIKEHTKPLNDEFYTIATRVFWILHDITEFPKCDTCGVEIRDNVYSVIMGYDENRNRNKSHKYKFCSMKCAEKHEYVYKRVQETKLLKYPNNYADITNKMMNTRLKGNFKNTFSRGYSKTELAIANELTDNLQNKYEILNRTKENNNIIKPYQIDILVKERQSQKIVLGIEYDGIFWHSVEFLRKNGKDYKNNHLNKTELMEKIGIPLVHIWEDEWLKDSNTILERIKTILNHNIQFPNEDIIRIDRSQYSSVLIPCEYKIVGIEKPTEVIRKIHNGKNQKHVYNCGYFICERIRK